MRQIALRPADVAVALELTLRPGQGLGPLATAVGITGGSMFDPEDVDRIAERIRTVSMHVTVEKTEMRNPFIILAVALFLLEIFIRRLVQYQKS